MFLTFYFRHFLNFTLISALFFPSLSAQEAFDHPANIPPSLHAQFLSAQGHLFNLDFDKSMTEFQKIQGHAKTHPMIAFGLASAHWWRLSVFVLETDENESRAFLDSVNECIRLCRQKMEEGDATGEAHLVYGGILGLWGRWEATNQNYLSAYFKGKKAYKYLHKALKINPSLKDAYMGIGIFDYYVATLPTVVRVLAFLGVGGDPQVGIKELRIAADESLYSRVPAKLFLADILANQENKPEESLKILKNLRKEFPNSSFIHMLEFIAFYNHGKTGILKDTAQDILFLFQNGTYRDPFLSQAYFAAGMAHFRHREWEKAIAYFDVGISRRKTWDAFYTWSFLYKGYALDALGRRGDAIEEYKTVLTQLRRWGSHDHAKARLKKPFTPQDEEMEKIKL